MAHIVVVVGQKKIIQLSRVATGNVRKNMTLHLWMASLIWVVHACSSYQGLSPNAGNAPTPCNCYLIAKEDVLLGKYWEILGNIYSPREIYHLYNGTSVNMRSTNCIGRNDTREIQELLKKFEQNLAHLCFNPSHRHTFTC